MHSFLFCSSALRILFVLLGRFLRLEVSGRAIAALKCVASRTVSAKNYALFS